MNQVLAFSQPEMMQTIFFHSIPFSTYQNFLQNLRPHFKFVCWFAGKTDTDVIFKSFTKIILSRYFSKTAFFIRDILSAEAGNIGTFVPCFNKHTEIRHR
jgi:hypothetical protein